MQSLPPSRFNNYRVTTTTKLTADVWNACLGDLSMRQAAVEVKATGYQAVIDAGIGDAINQVNNALAPQVAAIQELIATANTYLDHLIMDGSIPATFVTQDSSHNFVTSDQLASLSGVATMLTNIVTLQSQASAVTPGRIFFKSTM